MSFLTLATEVVAQKREKNKTKSKQLSFLYS